MHLHLRMENLDLGKFPFSCPTRAFTFMQLVMNAVD